MTYDFLMVLITLQVFVGVMIGIIISLYKIFFMEED